MKIKYITVAAFLLLAVAGTSNANSFQQNIVRESFLSETNEQGWNKQEVEGIIINIISIILEIPFNYIDLETMLVADLGMDSLELYQLCIDTQTWLNIQFNIGDVLMQATLFSVAEYANMAYYFYTGGTNYHN